MLVISFAGTSKVVYEIGEIVVLRILHVCLDDLQKIDWLNNN